MIAERAVFVYSHLSCVWVVCLYRYAPQHPHTFCSRSGRGGGGPRHPQSAGEQQNPDPDTRRAHSLKPAPTYPPESGSYLARYTAVEAKQTKQTAYLDLESKVPSNPSRELLACCSTRHLGRPSIGARLSPSAFGFLYQDCTLCRHENKKQHLSGLDRDGSWRYFTTIGGMTKHIARLKHWAGENKPLQGSMYAYRTNRG